MIEKPQASSMAIRVAVAFILVLCISENLNEAGARKIARNNKSLITTRTTIHGDIYDCIDFYKQPAFDHPALANHRSHPKIQPSSYTIASIRNVSYSEIDEEIKFLWLEKEGCPAGTIPIKRSTEDDLIRAKLAAEAYAPKLRTLTTKEPGTHYAIIKTNGEKEKKFNGGGMLVSVFNPTASGSQYSSSLMKLMNGADSIEVGWTVTPSLYNDTQSRLFIFTNAGTTRCYNTFCPGFVVTNSIFPLGVPFKPSKSGGVYHDQYFFISRDVEGKWWLSIRLFTNTIGYWPKEIFAQTGLTNLATTIEWGGKAYSPPDIPSPPMGAGNDKLSDNTYYNDAYCSLITTINETFDFVYDTKTSSYADIPGYQVLDKGFDEDESIRHIFLYGGAGGYTGN